MFKKGILLVFIFFSNFCPAVACLSITDDLNFPNPTLNADFSLLPDVSPFTDCWNTAFKIRSSQNNWRLVANRTGPDPISVSGDPTDNVMARDLTLNYSIMSFGMTSPTGAVLVSPFSSETDLSSVQSGTFIVSGITKSGTSCSASNPNYYKLSKALCLFRDFLFNIGEYSGQVSYLLIAP